MPVLVRALSSGDTDARLAACGALCRMGPSGRAAARPLVAQLTHADRRVRSDALHALLRIAPPLAWAVPALLRVLDDESPMVRQPAARVLALVGKRAADATPALERILAGDDRREAWLRLYAAMALWRIAGPGPIPVRALRALLASDVPALHAHAARALARLRPSTPEVLAALEQAARSRHPMARHHARTRASRTGARRS